MAANREGMPQAPFTQPDCEHSRAGQQPKAYTKETKVRRKAHITMLGQITEDPVGDQLGRGTRRQSVIEVLCGRHIVSQQRRVIRRQPQLLQPATLLAGQLPHSFLYSGPYPPL